MTTLRVVGAIGALALAAAAHADIAFSFADPAGGRQLANTANGGGTGIGRMTYDNTIPITFIVDRGLEGTTTFTNARLELTDFNLGTAITINMFTLAQITGSFTFYDFTGGVRNDIVTGTATNSAFVRIGQTNALMFSSAKGFTYTAGPALTAVLAGETLSGPQEAVFSLTDLLVDGGSPLVGAGGTFNSFTANSSFSGNSGTVPAPGSIALLGLAAAATRRRR